MDRCTLGFLRRSSVRFRLSCWLSKRALPPRLEQKRHLAHSGRVVSQRARGLVSRRSSGSRVDVVRIQPPADLADVVEKYWTGRWDLESEPHTTELLSDPSVHFVVEGGDLSEDRVVGVWTQLWQRTLSGRGWVRGVKLRPGALRAFADQPAESLTNRMLPLEVVLGSEASTLKLALGAASDEEAAAGASDWLRRRRSHVNPGRSSLAVELVQHVARDPELTSVEQLTTVSNLQLRTLQRLFRDYVGASPKWVIRRYRLQEVAQRLELGQVHSLAGLAAELGYSDQAHLTRDFQHAVGKSPREFASFVHE